MTVLQAIQKSAEFLEKKGVESPRLQSELLLAHVLEINRLKLYLRHGEELSTAVTESFRDLIKRRGQREPLQHLIGSVEFCGIEMKVSASVLIPRQETELLAEQGWLFLNTLPSATPGTFVDLGTGSGCIAIALAVHAPAASGIALDISPAALEIAQHNASQAQVRPRINFFLSDLFASLPGEQRFDLVISNPPYIPKSELPNLQLEVRNFDPHVALFGGEDGLDYFRMIARSAFHFLRPEGKLMLEFGEDQEKWLPAIFAAHNWIVEKILPDYTGRARILIARH